MRICSTCSAAASAAGFPKRARNGPREEAPISRSYDHYFQEEAAFAPRRIRLTKDVACSDCNGSGAAKGTSKPLVRLAAVPAKFDRSNTPLEHFKAFALRALRRQRNDRHTVSQVQRCGKDPKTVTLSVDIPAGVDNESVIPLRGQGRRATEGLRVIVYRAVSLSPSALSARAMIFGWRSPSPLPSRQLWGTVLPCPLFLRRFRIKCLPERNPAPYFESKGRVSKTSAPESPAICSFR